MPTFNSLTALALGLKSQDVRALVKVILILCAVASTVATVSIAFSLKRIASRPTVGELKNAGSAEERKRLGDLIPQGSP